MPTPRFREPWLPVEEWRQDTAFPYFVHVRVGGAWFLGYELKWARSSTMPAEPQVGEMVKVPEAKEPDPTDPSRMRSIEPDPTDPSRMRSIEPKDFFDPRKRKVASDTMHPYRDTKYPPDELLPSDARRASRELVEQVMENLSGSKGVTEGGAFWVQATGETQGLILRALKDVDVVLEARTGPNYVEVLFKWPS